MTVSDHQTIPFSWAVAGPGEIAEVFAGAVADAGAGAIATVLGRRPGPAAAFAARHGGRAVGSLEELLDRDAVDGLYVATPHVAHESIAAAALDAGVAVLCEKPLTTDPAATADLVRRSERTGTPLMEAWMYRAHPQLAALLEVIASGEIGALRSVTSTFSFRAPFDPEHRLFAPALGGGAIWDVGGYPLSFALACARAAGIDGSAAELVEAHCRIGPSGVDHESSAALAVGTMRADLRVAIDGPERMEAVAVGSAGRVFLPHPFLPAGHRRGTRGQVIVDGPGGTRTLMQDAPHCAYGAEAHAFIELARGGGAPAWPLVTHGETLSIAELLLAWRQRGSEHSAESRP